MAPLFACLTFSARVQAVTPAPNGGYLDGNTVERDNGLFGSPAGCDKRPLAIKLKSRQGTCYEGKTTNTRRDQRHQPKDVT
jgi:hypothetical protein